MSDDHFDPDSLADFLDSLFDGDNLPEAANDPLVDSALRLANAPKPELDPASFETIRAQLLKQNQANMSAQRAASRAPSVPLTTLVGVVAIIVVSIVVGIYVISSRDDNASANLPEETLQPEVIVTEEVTADVTEEITATPTATDTAEATPELVPEQVEQAEDTPQAEEAEPSATDTPTETATATATPTNTPDPSETPLPINLVIEGPVQDIIGNILIIYDFEIVVDPEDPLLSVIQIGDVVRIDGTMEIVNDPTNDSPPVIQIQPTIIEPVNGDIQINAGTGEAWRDDNTCNNPPPAWAPAHGWRARCEGAPAPGNSGNGNNGNGNAGNGNNGNGNGGNPNDCPGNSCNAPGQGGNGNGNGGNGNGNGNGNNSDDD